MSIALTGASGFIGRNVLADLERRGLSPVLVCRNRTHTLSHASVTFDIEAAPMDAFAQMGRPATLIHLAWGGLPNYQSLHHFEAELPIHYRFLKAMIESGLENLVVTGTCLEYGMQPGALREDLPARPVTAYGLAKDMLRCQLQHLQAVRPFKLTWARLFYMYGEGQSEKSLLTQLRTAVGRGERVFNMSLGEQLRDYLPVGEVASHLVGLALAEREHGIVNICSGQPTSVRSMVESWIETNGWSIEMNRGCYPYPQYEPMAFWGDATKLARCRSDAPGAAQLADA